MESRAPEPDEFNDRRCGSRRRPALAVFKQHYSLSLIALVVLIFGGSPALHAADNTVTEFSTRSRIGSGPEIGYMVFILGGGGSKRVLFRVLGPSLVDSGLSAGSVVQDPTFEVFNGSGVLIAANDNWRSTQEAAIRETGRAPTNDLESASIAVIPAGNYSIRYQGKNSASGVAQVEIIDLDQPQPGSPWFRSIASRGHSGGADNPMVNYFALSGPDFANVVLRGRGPSQSASSGVPGFSENPNLQLRYGDGGPIYFNEDWRDTQEATFRETGLAPPNDKEAAIVAGLGARRYRADIGGAAGRVVFEWESLTAPGSTASPIPLPGVSPPPSAAPGQLLNISTRVNVGTGENALIGGFIITGTSPKKVIIRAIGPSLASGGVAGALADPVLDLFDRDGNPIASNDNWKATQREEIEASTIPPGHDAESAIVRELNPGLYTAAVRGKDNGTGIGLVEAYDLAPNASSKLANISSRAFVNTGDDVLIAGIIVGGNAGATRIMVRAIGPSLAGANVQTPLQDPTLELVDANGSVLRSNDNWNAEQQAELRQTGIAPANNLESAVIASLAPSNYTAVVRGKSNTTGVSVVEVYRLD